jgi:hypothetical protein
VLVHLQGGNRLAMIKYLLPAAIALTPLSAIAHDGVPHDQGLPKATINQLHALAEAIAPYHDFDVAKREGWKKFGGDEPLMGEHWHHPKGPDYVGSNADLDFTRPSNLMYTNIGGKQVLTGVTFNVRLADGEAVPEGFAGKADRWHVHDMLRAIEAALKDRPFLRWLANSWIDATYRDKGDDRGRLAMVHVWLGVENPDGIFADHNRVVPYLKLGLPASHADGASMAAAHGLALATDTGCADTVDGKIWIANVPNKTAKALRSACRAEAAIVQQELRSSPARLNAAAEAAWRRFDAKWQAALTPEQHHRIAQMTEHGGGHDAPDKNGDHQGHH